MSMKNYEPTGVSESAHRHPLQCLSKEEIITETQNKKPHTAYIAAKAEIQDTLLPVTVELQSSKVQQWIESQRNLLLMATIFNILNLLEILPQYIRLTDRLS